MYSPCRLCRKPIPLPVAGGRPQVYCAACRLSAVLWSHHAAFEPMPVTQPLCAVCREPMSRRATAVTCSRTCRTALSATRARLSPYVVRPGPFVDGGSQFGGTPRRGARAADADVERSAGTSPDPCCAWLDDSDVVTLEERLPRYAAVVDAPPLPQRLRTRPPGMLPLLSTLLSYYVTSVRLTR